MRAIIYRSRLSTSSRKHIEILLPDYNFLEVLAELDLIKNYYFNLELLGDATKRRKYTKRKTGAGIKVTVSSANKPFDWS